MPEGETEAKPLPKPGRGRPNRIITVEQVDAAMTRAGGNRDVAAKELGITNHHLRVKISRQPFLRLRWSKKAVWKRLRAVDASPSAAVAVDPVTHMENQIDNVCMQISGNARTIIGRMSVVNERIEKGEQARTSEDPEFKRLWSFKCNVRGEPTEEAMIREEYRELLEQLRKDAEAVAGISLKRAQTSMIMRKMQGGKSGVERKAKAGFVPKGESLRPVMISNSQVVVQNGKEPKSNG